MTTWKIYRCPPSLTIPFSDKLNEVGVETYAPELNIRRRIPRTRRYEPRRLAILPSFLFMDVSAGVPIPTDISQKLLPMVVNMKEAEASHQDITNMREFMEKLRGHVRKTSRKDGEKTHRRPDVPVFGLGSKVDIVGGLLAGISGVVLSFDKDHVQIDTKTLFGVIKVSPFILKAVQPI